MLENFKKKSAVVVFMACPLKFGTSLICFSGPTEHLSTRIAPSARLASYTSSEVTPIADTQPNNIPSLDSPNSSPTDFTLCLSLQGPRRNSRAISDSIPQHGQTRQDEIDQVDLVDLPPKNLLEMCWPASSFERLVLARDCTTS